MNNDSCCLWVHYSDNGVGVSNYSTPDEALCALGREITEIENNKELPTILEWEINPN